MTKVNDFIKRELEDCRDNGITVNFVPTKTLRLGCEGWFDSTSRILEVAVKKPKREWLPVFIHETCHKDQFIENDIVWDTLIDGIDACQLFDDWLNHKIELSTSLLRKVISIIVKVEIDCEVRSVEKMFRHNLPIDIYEYTKAANNYVYSYLAMLHTRKWVPGVTYNQELLALMPSTFQEEYKQLPKGYLKVFKTLDS